MGTISSGNIKRRVREIGLTIGVIPPGKNNSITDVSGVSVGQITLVREDDIRTGVTVVIPHPGNVFQEKLPAAIEVGNGFGKLIGYTQVRELGVIESPIALTNTLSAPTAAQALNHYTLTRPGNEVVRSYNPIVGETNDGRLNNIRAHTLVVDHVLEALSEASAAPVEEGSLGAGTGTICLGFKGGIGSASRIVNVEGTEYTVGILVQTNFGGQLQIAGVPVGRILADKKISSAIPDDEKGSCMIVIATDAPLSDRQLGRVARHSFFGIARTGGIMSHGSGDYAIAFSTADKVRIFQEPKKHLQQQTIFGDQYLNPLFHGVIEATEEAIFNSLFMATAVTGVNGFTAPELPVDEVLDILKKYKIDLP